MKKNYFLFLLMILGLTALSCGDDEPGELSAREQALEILSGTWDLESGGSITLDGQDVSLNFRGFSLSFTDGEYNTTNAGDLLNANGTWEFTDEAARMVRLDSGEEISIIVLTETRFEFSFFSNGSGGSAAGIGGTYVINLNK